MGAPIKEGFSRTFDYNSTLRQWPLAPISGFSKDIGSDIAQPPVKAIESFFGMGKPDKKFTVPKSWGKESPEKMDDGRMERAPSGAREVKGGKWSPRHRGKLPSPPKKGPPSEPREEVVKEGPWAWGKMPQSREERRASKENDAEKSWPRVGEGSPGEGAKFGYQPKLTSAILPKLRAEPTSDVKWRCSAMGGCDDTKYAPLARESGWATGSAPEMRSSFLESQEKMGKDGKKLGKGDSGKDKAEGFFGKISFGMLKSAAGGGEEKKKDQMPEVIPRISPTDYPKLEWQDREKDIPAPIKYNKTPPPYIKYDAPHRWTQELGFKPLTRKDFPRWIDEDPDKNWIARKYPPKRVALYKKRFADFGWKKPHKTMGLIGIASKDQLGKKMILPSPEKLARKFWHENDDSSMWLDEKGEEVKGKPMEWTKAIPPDGREENAPTKGKAKPFGEIDKESGDYVNPWKPPE